MATPLGAMRIELELDSSKFASNLNASKKAVNYFKAEARALDAAMKSNGNTMTLLGAKQKTLTQALDKQGEVLARLKKNFNSLDVGSKKWESAAIEIERENAKLEQLRAELGRVETAMKKVHAENSNWGHVGTFFTNMGNGVKKFGSILTNMGNAMMPVSTALSAGFTLATKKALDFGGEMQTVKALLSDTVTDTKTLDTMTTQLGDNSKKWAKQFGISTSDINLGMQEVIKAGFDANQTIGAMPAILTASKATGEEFGTVMGATTSILSQFGLITSDTNQMLKNTNRVTDSLSFVANKTKAGFSDMGLAMEYVGPVANSVGMSIEETASAIGILSNAGIDGQKAGTALRGALSKLLDPSKENAAAFEQLGFSAEEFRSGAIKLPDVIDRIRKNTEGMTDAQKAAVIAQAFGIEAQSGINALVSAGADELNKLTDATKGAAGYTDELYKKMSGSGKSAVDRFRSSLEVLQITVGEKLLPNLTPIIEKVTEWVEKFAEADESTQKFWMAIAGGFAVAYPFLNLAGIVFSAVGNLSTAFGGLSTKMSEVLAKKAVASTLASVATSATTTGTAMAGAAGNTSLLASAIAGVGGLVPALGILAGVVAVGTVAYFAQQALDARQRTEEWGTAVSKTEAQELSTFKTKVDETNQAMTAFSENGVQDVEAVKVAFQGLVDEITKLTDKELAKDLKIAEQMGMSPEVITQIKKSHEQMKSNVQQMSDEVIAIYQRASEQRRALTEEEKSIVLANQNELIDAQLSLLDYSEKEKLAITKAMNGQFDELNKEQLAKYKDVAKKWIEEENKSYEERKNNLKELYDSIKGSDEAAVRARSEIQADLSQLEADHLAKMDAYGQRYAEIRKKMAEQVTFTNKYEEQSYWNVIKKEMEGLELSYEELMLKATQASSKIQEGHSMWAQTVADASEETKTANSQWNAMTWDLKEGKLKTNAQEEIQKALQAEGGWDNLKFVAKHANLDTNAKIAIGEALVATGQWDSLSPQDKALVVDGQPAIKAIVESKENLAIWNSMPEGVKKLLGENQQFMSSAETAKTTLNNWNLLQPTQKDLIANDLASGNAASAQQAINALTGKTVGLNADDLPLLSKVVESNQAVNSLQQTNVPVMNAVDGTGPAVAQAQAGVNSPYQVSPIGIFAQNNTGGPASQAHTGINSVRQQSPASIDAVNNASAAAKQATWDLNSIPKTITTTITTFVSKVFGFEKGTDFHPGGLAMVNDQKGPLYRELVTLPSGESFIPEGRDVILPLPRGSKVLPARQTRDLMRMRGIPRYADGIGFPADAVLFQDMDKFERQSSTEISLNLPDNDKILAVLHDILNAINRYQGDGRDSQQDIHLDLEKVGEIITGYQRFQEYKSNRMRGVLE
ncbi:TPA: phage tail tape measure protein [Streptococcus suis]|nr:phage tail tape measure protein [Streptococcus suis]